MKKITNLTESSFLPFIAIILLFQSSPIFSQGTFWNNTGAKITIGKGTYINGPKTTMLNDSNTVIVNQGNIIVEEMKNKGNLELKGTDATIVIDSTLILEKGKILLNANKILLNNPDTAALQRTNGYLVAKDSLWGKLIWRVGEADVGWKYVVPFVNDSLEDVGIELEIVEAGVGNGQITFSTYGTDSTNTPAPAEVQQYPVAKAALDTNALKIADRYWMILADSFSQNPMFKVRLNYTDAALQSNEIIEDSLNLAVLENGCWTWNLPTSLSENRAFSDSLQAYGIYILHDSIMGRYLPKTKLRDGHCGVVGVRPDYVLEADIVSCAVQYEFEILSDSLAFDTLLLSANNELDLSRIDTLLHGITYSVRVRVFDGFVFNEFGEACAIKIDTVNRKYCGNEDFGLLSEFFPQIEGYENPLEPLVQAYLDSLDSLSPEDSLARMGGCVEEYIIPVVVHIFSVDGNDLSIAQIQSQIDRLNAEFNNPNQNSISGVSACIQFCLAQNLPQQPQWAGLNWDSPELHDPTSVHPPTPGITRNLNNADLAGLIIDLFFPDPNYPVVSTPHYFPPENYLNIYVVDEIGGGGALGYASLPLILDIFPNFPYDGVFVASGYFGDNYCTTNNLANCNNFPLAVNYDRGWVSIHEIGHYLGLYHTFHHEFGFNTNCVNTDCTVDGDKVCDTPPQSGPHCAPPGPAFGCSCTAPNPNVICTGLPPQITNYLDYGHDICMNTFTVGQINRMHATLSVFRPDLISEINLLRTGVAGISGCEDGFLSSEFTVDITEGCVNSTQVTFTGAGHYDEWEFTFTTTGNSFSVDESSIVTNPSQPFAQVTFPAVGLWTVSLTVSSTLPMGTSSLTKQDLVDITNCLPITSGNNQWHFGNQAVIDFRSGVAQTGFPSSQNTFMPAATVCDPTT